MPSHCFSPLSFSSCIVLPKKLQINVAPVETFSFLNTFWSGVHGVSVRKRQQDRLMLWKGNALTQEGQRKTSFVVFGLVHPEFLCLSARAALKCLTIHFSVVIERSLLPTAQHFFHPARKHSSAMELRQTILCLSAACAASPQGGLWMWGGG